MLGPHEKDDKCVNILNRTVTWTREGIRYEADPRHVEIALRDMELANVRGVLTPKWESRMAGR